MRKYSILVIGIFCLMASLIWMVLSQSSTGPFLILAEISGALIIGGIYEVKKK